MFSESEIRFISHLVSSYVREARYPYGIIMIKLVGKAYQRHRLSWLTALNGNDAALYLRKCEFSVVRSDYQIAV